VNRQLSVSRRLRTASIRAVLIRTAAAAGLLVATISLTTVGPATSASAHNLLISSDPADKATVATLPSQISLTFNEPALAIGSQMRVVGPAGDEAQGAPTLIDRNVQQALKPGSPAGAYTVLWRVTSLDGHPISGQFTFTASAGNGGTAPAPVAGSAPADTALSVPGEGGGGSSTPIIVLLIVAGVAVVIAGFWLARHRPGPSLADDEQPAAEPADADEPAGPGA
jgi:methionine-rich copper-binding protein CopC